VAPWQIERVGAHRKLLRVACVVLVALATGLVGLGRTDGVRAASFAAGDTVVVDTDYLNLRSGADLASSVIAVLPGGFALTVTAGPTAADGHDWYGVRTGDGRTGWVAAEYLALGQSWGGFAVGDFALVDAAPLNCRTGPGVGYDVSYLMSIGTGVQILAGPEVADGYHWYKVRTDAEVVGWAAGEGLVPAYSVPGPRFTAGDQVVVDTDYLNLRDDIGLATGVIDILPGGTALSVTNGPFLADGYAWYRVQTGSGRLGWVVGAYLAAAPPLPLAVGDAVRVIDGALNLRAAPSLSAAVVRVMADNEALLIQGGPVEADGYTWYRVSNYAGEGWAAGEYLRLDPKGFPPEYGGSEKPG
jgi:uncharacterized protein YgiM (DUF1202 family)